jgi:hypothetical protein
VYRSDTLSNQKKNNQNIILYRPISSFSSKS